MNHDDYLAQRRMPALDGVRAISILLVVTAHPAYAHIWPALHGASGVTIFFVLSGYLITRLLLREEQVAGGISLVAFYIRRVFRIYPLYFLVIFVYCILIYGLGEQADRRHAFTANLADYLLFFPEHAIFFGHGVRPPFDGAWSLGIEEKFYFVWPLLGFVLIRGALGKRIASLAVIGIGCGVAPALVSWGDVLQPYTHIAIGCVLALLLNDLRSYAVLSRLTRPIPLGLLAMAGVVAQFSTSQILVNEALYVPYGLVIGLALVAVVTGAGGTRWLAARPLVFIGKISYALYLVHNFGLNLAEKLVPQTHGFLTSLASTLIGLSLSVAVCWVLYRYVEQPLIRLGHKISARLTVRRTPRVGAHGGRAAPAADTARDTPDPIRTDWVDQWGEDVTDGPAAWAPASSVVRVRQPEPGRTEPPGPSPAAAYMEQHTTFANNVRHRSTRSTEESNSTEQENPDLGLKVGEYGNSRDPAEGRYPGRQGQGQPFEPGARLRGRPTDNDINERD